MENQIINEILSKIADLYQDIKDRNVFPHPIASDFLRPEVTKYLFKCIDEGIPEDQCVNNLSKIFKFNDKCKQCGFCEKETFEGIILFTYRTLKEYIEH